MALEGTTLNTTAPVILIILDGFGINPRREGNAIANASTPHLEALLKNYPNCRLSMSGVDVGLPAGQMGNSEVGHMNIGAGRVVYQDYTRIEWRTQFQTGRHRSGRARSNHRFSVSVTSAIDDVRSAGRCASIRAHNSRTGTGRGRAVSARRHRSAT